MIAKGAKGVRKGVGKGVIRKMEDVPHDNLTNKINDLRRYSTDKKSLLPHGGSIVRSTKEGSSGDGYYELNVSTSALLDPIELIHSQKIAAATRTTPLVASDPPTNKTMNETKRAKTPNQTFKKLPPSGGFGSFNIQERPASRLEINGLEKELEERVRLVLEKRDKKKPTLSNSIAEESQEDAYDVGMEYQPYQESLVLLREQILMELDVQDKSALKSEPWLETYIKCASLKGVCDESAAKFSDMLSVSSGQLGNILRKLRLTYIQAFEQMHFSWKSLRKAFLMDRQELADCKVKIRKLG